MNEQMTTAQAGKLVTTRGKRERVYVLPRYRVTIVRDGGVSMEARSIADGATSARVLRPLIAEQDREYFVALFVDARQRLIGLEVVAVGTLSASLVHPREVFKGAMLAGAAAVIVGHNHPSGDCHPSEEDREVTRRLRRASEILGVPVMDHVIVSSPDKGPGYFSFREHGLL